MKTPKTASPDKVDFSLNLKRIRRHANIKQAPLAKLCGVTIRTWGAWESLEQPTWPPSDKLASIAKALSCSIDDLFGTPPEWLPNSVDERELLAIVRKSRLPVRQIVMAVINTLEEMLAEDRKLWGLLGARLRKNFKRK